MKSADSHLSAAKQEASTNPRWEHGEEREMQAAKRTSAPSYQLSRARYAAANSAQNILNFDAARPKSRPTAKEVLQNAYFRLGFLCGLLLSLIAFVAVMWLWAIPTVESVVATAQHASETAAAHA